MTLATQPIPTTITYLTVPDPIRTIIEVPGGRVTVAEDGAGVSLTLDRSDGEGTVSLDLGYAAREVFDAVFLADLRLRASGVEL